MQRATEPDAVAAEAALCGGGGDDEQQQHVGGVAASLDSLLWRRRRWTDNLYLSIVLAFLVIGVTLLAVPIVTDNIYAMQRWLRR